MNFFIILYVNTLIICEFFNFNANNCNMIINNWNLIKNWIEILYKAFDFHVSYKFKIKYFT